MDFFLFNKTIRCGDESLINWLQLIGLSLYNEDLSLQHYTYLQCKCRVPSSSFPENFSAIFCCFPLKYVALKIISIKLRKPLSWYTSKPGRYWPPNPLWPPSLVVSMSSYNPKVTNVMQVVFADDLDMFTCSSMCTQVLSRRRVHSQSQSWSPARVEDFLHRRFAMS